MTRTSIPESIRIDRQRRRWALDDGLIGDRPEIVLACDLGRAPAGVRANPEVDE